MYHYSPARKPRESFDPWMEDGLCRLYTPSPPTSGAQGSQQFSLMLRGDVDMYFERSGAGQRWTVYCMYVPAWETERPANSINWSSEKAPMDMRSLSSAAAFLADMVCESFSSMSRLFWGH